jgi:uncharacterized protein (DUF4415 family)
MEELRKQLFNLAVIHGLKSCYTMLDSLRDEVRAHGQFLVGEYEVIEEVKTTTVPVESSMAHEIEVKTEEVVKKVRKPRIKKVKDELIDEAAKETENTVKGTEHQLVETTIDEPVVDKLKGNAKKRWQREQEALKRLELQSKGIFKHDILTIENVTSWIKEGKSYAVIARGYVGCTEEEVSKYCKKHNITQ